MSIYSIGLKPESILPLMYEMKYIVRAGGFPDGVLFIAHNWLVNIYSEVVATE